MTEPRTVFRQAGPVGLEVREVEDGDHTMCFVQVVDGQAGAVCVVVRDGRLLLGSHPRPVLGGRISAELPRGMGDPGESAEETAVRELREETGLVAAGTRHLGTFYADTGLLANPIAVVEITVEDGDPLASPPGEVEEFLDLEWVTPDELRQRTARGEIICGITLAAFAMWQAHR